MREFIVYAPPFDTKSAGILMLHFLSSSLNEIGARSRVVEFGNLISDDEKENAIIIYPEIIHNNPLGAKKIAYYMLNKDGLLWGKKIERTKNCFIFTYLKHYEPEAPIAFFPLIDLDKMLFSDSIDNRELNMIYFGKGPTLNINFDGKKPYLLITRTWPKDKDLLISFFQSTRFFHTTDCMSTIFTEALLCGAAPIIHYWDPAFDKNELLSGEFPEVFQMQEEQDFSSQNVLRKSESMRKKIIEHQKNWPKKLAIIAQMMQDKFRF